MDPTPAETPQPVEEVQHVVETTPTEDDAVHIVIESSLAPTPTVEVSDTAHAEGHVPDEVKECINEVVQQVVETSPPQTREDVHPHENEDDARRMALKKREPPALEGSPVKRTPKVFLTLEEKETLPKLWSAKEDDPMFYVKFQSGETGWEWYVTAYNGGDILYGLVKGELEEWGQFSISELLKLGTVERDFSFSPQRLSALANANDLKDVRHTIYA